MHLKKKKMCKNLFSRQLPPQYSLFNIIVEVLRHTFLTYQNVYNLRANGF